MLGPKEEDYAQGHFRLLGIYHDHGAAAPNVLEKNLSCQASLTLATLIASDTDIIAHYRDYLIFVAFHFLANSSKNSYQFWHAWTSSCGHNSEHDTPSLSVAPPRAK